MDVEEFRELLAAKGLQTAVCLICKSTAWEGVGSAAQLPLEGYGEGDSKAAKPIVTATCGNCGFILSFDPNVLLSEWVSGRLS